MTAQPKSASSRLLVSLLPLALLLLCIAPASARSITGAHFSLTIANNWDTLPSFPGVPKNDSMVMVMDTASKSVAYFIEGQGNNMTPEEFAAAMEAAHADGEGLVKENSGPKVIGGKTFYASEWKDTAEDNTTSRVRFYAVSMGNMVFLAWVGYDTEEGPDVVAQFEAALATLQFSGVSVRRYARNLLRPERMIDPRDLLGRSHGADPARLPKMYLFSRSR